MIPTAQIGFFSLTAQSMSISQNDNITGVSVLCTTDTLGTIQGQTSPAMTIDGLQSQAISTPKNFPITFENSDGRVIENITITAPAGCTLLVILKK